MDDEGVLMDLRILLRQWLLASRLPAALHDILDRREPLEQAHER